MVTDFGTKKTMLYYYKIWNNVGRISGCLPHGWNWSDMVPVYFRDQTTATWRWNCILWWWCQCRSIGVARGVKKICKNTDNQCWKRTGTTSKFLLMHSGSESTYITVFVLNILYELIHKLTCSFFDFPSP